MITKAYFVLMLTLVCTKAFSQDIDWTKSKKWTIYNTRDDRALKFSLDTLSAIPSKLVNQDSVHLYLRSLEIWPKDKYSMWMGVYIATCEIDGKKRKIDVSVYGGFIFDEETKRYYQLPLELRKDWLEFWSRQIQGFES